MRSHALYLPMAPTLVAASVGVLLAAALLGPAFDRRSVAIVVLAAVAPSLDAALSLVVHGATNAAFHTLVLPGLAAIAVYWDVSLRESSWIRDRWGWQGVRTAWVAIAAYAVVGIGLALFVGEGANLFYPIHDRFYAVDGRLLLSSDTGVEQTYLTLGDPGSPALDSPGTTADHHVASWINPTPGTGLERGVDRRIALVEAGWQVALVAAAAVVLAVRGREGS